MTKEDWQMIRLLESSQEVTLDKDQLIMKQGVSYVIHVTRLQKKTFLRPSPPIFSNSYSHDNQVSVYLSYSTWLG